MQQAIEQASICSWSPVREQGFRKRAYREKRLSFTRKFRSYKDLLVDKAGPRLCQISVTCAGTKGKAFSAWRQQHVLILMKPYPQAMDLDTPLVIYIYIFLLGSCKEHLIVQELDISCCLFDLQHPGTDFLKRYRVFS